MDETLIRHDYLECSNEYSEKCYLVALTRDASDSHRVTSAYGKIGGSLRSSAKVVGTDLRSALATYETTVNQKLARGYQVERLVSPRREVADWLIDLGARATDIWSPLRGLAIEPEERAARLPVGAVASPTLRKRLVPSERPSTISGRSWLSIDHAGSASLIDEQSARLVKRINLAEREPIDRLAPLLPLVLEGSRGSTDPVKQGERPDLVSFSTLLAEDIVVLAGEPVGDLPWAERSLLLEHTLKAIDTFGDGLLLYGPEVRGRLADEVRELLAGRLGQTSVAIPLARRLDSSRGEPGSRLLIGA